MKIYRIISLGWIAWCIFVSLIFCQFAISTYWLENGLVTTEVSGNIGMMFFYLFGAVASVFLHGDFLWSRISMVGVAFLNGLYCGVGAATSVELSLKSLLLFVVFYSWVSMIILLIPKRFLMRKRV